MISTKKQFIFVHIPKTAGSSVSYCLRHSLDRASIFHRASNSLSKRVLGRRVFDPDGFQPLRNHATAREYRKHFGDHYWQMKSFSFVRNPYDLLVSMFSYMQQHHGHPEHERVQGLSFRDYILSTFDPDRPARFQTQFLTDAKDRQIVHRIGRFETIGESFDDITRNIGLKVRLPHMNKSKRGKYIDHYDPETIERVAHVFQREFDLLGYSTDPTCTEFGPIKLERHPKLVD